MTDKLVDWAMRLQSLAQAGLTYGKDSFAVSRNPRYFG